MLPTLELAAKRKAQLYGYLEAVGQRLDLTETQYERARTSYEAVGTWLMGGRFLDPHGVARDLHELCKQAACSKFEFWRGLTRSLWGAYGVVGFSGVKDARKSVFIADASASAGF